MAEWARVVNTTTKQFLKGETVQVLRNRKLLAMLNDRGRITHNHSGTEVQWQVRYKQAPMIGFDDSDTMTSAVSTAGSRPACRGAVAS